MRERFERQMERGNLSEAEAIDKACANWTCDQEMQEALRPRVWSAEDITVEQLRWLYHSGPVELHFSADSGIEIVHQSALMGPIFVKDQEAADKLQKVTNEVWR